MKYFFLSLCSLLVIGCGNTSSDVEIHKDLPNIPYPTKTPSGHSLTCSRVYDPVCVEIQSQCETIPCEYEQQTFENTCVIRGFDNINILFRGTCEDDESNNPTSDLYSAFFISRDFEVCSIKEFDCEENQTPFNDARGCGCINTPAPEKKVEPLPETDILVEDENILVYDNCPSLSTKINCPNGWTEFNTDEGCGCTRN